MATVNQRTFTGSTTKPGIKIKVRAKIERGGGGELITTTALEIVSDNLTGAYSFDLDVLSSGTVHYQFLIEPSTDWLDVHILDGANTSIDEQIEAAGLPVVTSTQEYIADNAVLYSSVQTLSAGQKAQGLSNLGIPALEADKFLYSADGVNLSWQSVSDVLAVWGNISGTLSDQTDLENRFNTKADLSGATFTGNLITSGALDKEKWLFSPYSANNYSAIYNNGVSPSATNYTLLANETSTFLNATTQVFLRINSNSSTGFKITSSQNQSMTNLLIEDTDPQLTLAHTSGSIETTLQTDASGDLDITVTGEYLNFNAPTASMLLNSTDASRATFKFNGSYGQLLNENGIFYITNSDANDPILLRTNNIERLRIDTNGKSIFSGEIEPASMANASASNNSIYYSTDASRLVYKDSGGTVNNLY